MKEGVHFDTLATFQPHSLGTVDKCPPPPPCFRVLSGKVQQCYILRDPTIGDFKSHHLQARVTALSVPPHLFFQQYMTKKVVFLGRSRPLGGGGGHVPLRPPLGLAPLRKHAHAINSIFHCCKNDNFQIKKRLFSYFCT